MKVRLKVFKSGQWGRRTVLLISWILSFLILVVFSMTSELNNHYNDAAGHVPEAGPISNQLGAVRYTRWDPQENYRPIYSVSCKGLSVENNTLGIFKTALHKVMKIQSLQFSFHQYSSGTNKTTTPDIHSFYREQIADVKVFVKQIMYKLTNPMEGWRVKNIDIGNVSEVHINNFDYKALYDDELFFTIQSKKAMVSYKYSGVVLRGHVTIKTADGSTLESNYVNWDIDKQHFSVNGVYVLNRDGVKTTGRDICVDTQLNRIKTRRAKSQQKEDLECFAKL